MINIIGSFAQFERDLIVDRTTEGRERAKKTGKHMGRPAQPQKMIIKSIDLYKIRETNYHSIKDILKLTGVPRATLYHELKKGE
jgi:DNA invertase Pin-like site-specific DNA recombinase